MECVRNFEKYFPNNNIDNIIKILNERRRKKMIDFISKATNNFPSLSRNHRLTILTF